jgi:hypothetical protein
MALFAVGVSRAVVFKTNVSLTSGQILTLKTVPVEIVAAPGAGKIIVPVRVAAAYTHVSAAYTHDGEAFRFGNAALDVGSSAYLASLAGSIVTEAFSQVGIADMDYKGVWPSAQLLNQALTMYYPGASNPAAGNGTMSVTVWYMVH